MNRWITATLPALMLAACARLSRTPDSAAAPATVEPTQPATAAPTLAPNEAQASVTPAPTLEAAAAGETPAPTLTQDATPTLRAGLAATDPSTFVLAAGQPQFVEFFAFW